MRKETLKKFGLCFITGCFIKSFNMMIDHFLFCKLNSSPIFYFWYQNDARNIERGIKEWQIARNGKSQYSFQR